MKMTTLPSLLTVESIIRISDERRGILSFVIDFEIIVGIERESA